MDTLQIKESVLEDVVRRVIRETVAEFLTAHEARPAPAVYSVSEFAAAIRRRPRYVSDRCRTGKIKTLPGKPYRIPAWEAANWILKPTTK
jgi:hypothetical protein